MVVLEIKIKNIIAIFPLLLCQMAFSQIDSPEQNLDSTMPSSNLSNDGSSDSISSEESNKPFNSQSHDSQNASGLDNLKNDYISMQMDFFKLEYQQK